MCPPVSMRYEGQGMSYLYASWIYHLQHGDQLHICFTCFHAAFLSFKDLLESEDLEDEDWDPELMEDAQAGPEQEGSLEMGPSWGQDQGQPSQGDSQAWGPGALASAPAGSEEAGLDDHFVPTELEPEDTMPLGLGPEDADWTQGLPWIFGGLATCSHWPSSLPA
ncbi:testis-expressed protein 19-like [Cynocephalus volans]|uniref:testis-expressed protein 19-like n=1 Tax=Cynocephalus volans TaxID=110931 RepID=UPI002FCAE980